MHKLGSGLAVEWLKNRGGKQVWRGWEVWKVLCTFQLSGVKTKKNCTFPPSCKCTYVAEFQTKRKDTTSHIFKIFKVRIMFHSLLDFLSQITEAVKMFRQLDFLPAGFQVKVVSKRKLSVCHKAPSLSCACHCLLNIVVKLHKKTKQKQNKLILEFSFNGVQKFQIATTINISICKIWKKKHSICCHRKYPHSPHRLLFLVWNPTPWKLQFRLILSFKNFGLPLTLCGGGRDIFWKHTIL